MAYIPTIKSLKDVALATLSSNQYLKWNGTSWINANLSLLHLSEIPALPVVAGNYFLKYTQGSGIFSWSTSGSGGGISSFYIGSDLGSPIEIEDGNLVNFIGESIFKFDSSSGDVVLGLDITGVDDGSVIVKNGSSYGWQSGNFIKVPFPDLQFDDDVSAGVAGVGLGEGYLTSDGNIWSMPENFIRIRKF